ncbi:hypothetical protein ACIT1K_003601, partial [Raoultella planticola]
MSAPQGEAMARLASCGQEKARIDADREKSRRISLSEGAGHCAGATVRGAQKQKNTRQGVHC